MTHHGVGKRDMLVAQVQPEDSSSQERGDFLACEFLKDSSTRPHITDEDELNPDTDHSRTTIPLRRRRSLPCPKSIPGNHFLQGIAIEDCKDLLSIPDPPTPPASLPKQSSARREAGKSAPLRDLSNGDVGLDSDPSSSLKMNKRNAPSTPSQTRKRSRLSLTNGNMMSPLVSTNKPPAVRTGSLQNPPLTEDTMQPLRIQISERVVDKQQSHSYSQRENEKLENTSSSSSFQMYKAPEYTPDVYEIPTQPDTDKLVEIRKLVQAYTLLPEKRRFESEEAKQIEAVTGYPVVPSCIPEGAVSEVEKHLRRHRIIANLPNRMKHVDACKVRDARLMQKATECRVRKLRGGYVEYFHVPSGRYVPPEEFEARYLCMVDEVSSIRSKSWGSYFAKLKEEMKAQESMRSEEENIDSSEASYLACTDMTNSENDERNGHADTNTSCEENFHENSKEISSPMQSIQSEEDEDEDMCTEVVYKTIELTKPHAQQEQRVIAPKTLQRSPSPTSPDMLLPFPPRHEPSSNASIARAELKLWAAIDDALSTYSKEVLEIQAAEARKTK